MSGHKKKNGGKGQVKNELIQQSAVLVLITTIGIWQYHFVMQAASSDIYIFALLFGAGFFGIYNTVRGTYSLGNDFVALNAVKEVHEDSQRKLISPEDHKIIVEKRMLSPPIPYDSPKSLGTAHNLIVEEMLRTGSLRISPQTMQVLVHDLEAKLDARKEMAHYLGALMVLLGLLGTFIGLMHTLESVGGILGSLDLSGNAGSGAIAGLIESLKRPLEGMATGFGASLFGLIGSLLIGILSKFDSNASNRLLHDFETWIRSVVQIEGAQARNQAAQTKSSDDASTALPSGMEPNAQNWRMIFQVARSTVISTSKMAAQLEMLANNVEKIRENSALGDAVLQDGLTKLSLDMNRLVSAQTATVVGMENLSSGMSDTRERVAGHLTQLTNFIENSVQHLASEQAHAVNGIDAIRSHASDTREQINNHLSHMTQMLETAEIQNTGSARHIHTELNGLRDTMVQSIEGTANTYNLLQYVEQRVSSIQSAGIDQQQRANAQREADELVANLDHLISASRLNPADVARLRNLSSMLEEMSSDEPREQEREFIFNAVRGVAK